MIFLEWKRIQSNDTDFAIFINKDIFGMNIANNPLPSLLMNTYCKLDNGIHHIPYLFMIVIPTNLFPPLNFIIEIISALNTSEDSCTSITTESILNIFIMFCCELTCMAIDMFSVFFECQPRCKLS